MRDAGLLGRARAGELLAELQSGLWSGGRVPSVWYYPSGACGAATGPSIGRVRCDEHVRSRLDPRRFTSEP